MSSFLVTRLTYFTVDLASYSISLIYFLFFIFFIFYFFHFLFFSFFIFFLHAIMTEGGKLRMQLIPLASFAPHSTNIRNRKEKS